LSRALPLLSGEEIVKVLEKSGFVQRSQKGSHVKLRNGFGRTVIIPMHRTVAKGTLASILRQAGISAEEFAEKL